ncbi:MAG TPA: HAMP domain-containing protein [Polyangiaceae bacterium]|nr:HAMP domain-containing protein [Polyangiaceae bacterium]
MSRSNDKLGEHAPPASSRRKGSLATRLAFGTVFLVLCVTGITVMELTHREWERLLESKRTAADMVANLFAGTMAPALDFGDVEAVKSGLDGLRSNAMIVYAAVYSADGANPIAEYHNGRGDGGPSDGARAEGEIQVQSGVHNPTGTRLGSVVIRVSLAQEVHAFRRTRARLIGFGALFAAALASLLVVIMRRVLVAPLGRLESAAIRLSAGDRVEVPADRDDELGSLSRAFNSMASAIDERERRIAAQNRRLQALFDNMGQATMVFGSDRLLTEERSRSAERWLDARPGNSIIDILYPEDDSLDIERQAFEAWLDVAFSAPADKFRELLELAPREIERRTGSQSMFFELSFRLAEQVGSTRQLMLLATDVTEQRRLERSVLEKDREHERELSALRRLATGGGELLGSFLEVARRRLATCRELCGSSPTTLGSERDPSGDRALVEGLFQHLHTIRAEARCFDLAQLEGEVTLVESELARIRKDEYQLSEADLGSLLRGIEHVTRRLDDAERAFIAASPLGPSALDQISVRRSRLMALTETTRSKNDRVARLVEELAARPLVESFALLPEAVSRWAERAGKKVQLALEPDGSEIPLALSRVLGGVLSHLLRNAVAHGIETESERLERGKPATGIVRVWVDRSPAGLSIHVSDDGRGFDLTTLGGDASQSSPQHAFAVALTPGVTTSATSGDLSGAGVGLPAVQNELRSVGYRIELESTSASGTSLTIAPLPRREGRVLERHVG